MVPQNGKDPWIVSLKTERVGLGMYVLNRMNTSNKKRDLKVGGKVGIPKILLPFLLFGVLSNLALAGDDELDLVATRVAENVYSIVSPSFGLPTPENRGWNSNSHFVVTEDGVLLFDTGSSKSIGNHIKKCIQSVTDSQVRWVINSHSHADHWFGNAAFPEADLMTSKDALATMKDHGPGAKEFYTKVTRGTIGDIELVYPEVLLTDGRKRNFGGVPVEFIFSNDGHSPGDLLMWLPEQRILFGGDVLGSDWMPIITGHGHVPHLIETLRRMAALNPAFVLPGHGQVTTGESVTRDAAFLSKVWEQVKADHKKSKTPDETISAVRSELGATYTAVYKDFESDIKRYVELMYELQPETDPVIKAGQ